MPTYELFHAIGDPGSARARTFIVDNSLDGTVRFRNVVYPEVQADLHDRGGDGAPALWDGTRLVSGEEAVLAELQVLAGVA